MPNRRRRDSTERSAQRGARVNPFEASPDAEFILEGGERDLKWYRRQVKPGDFVISSGPDNYVSALRGHRLTDDDRQRINTILEHWQRYESSAAAVRSHPILAIKIGRKYKILDGWHRLLAWRAAGLRGKLTTVVGETARRSFHRKR